MKEKHKRFWEVDSLRGTALIVMIFFHIFYDLNHLEIYEINMFSYPLFLFFLPFAGVFLFLVGISLTLSYSRASKKLTERQLQKKFIIRGLEIFSMGLLITFATWLYLQDGFVIFCVLHCIGISIILAYPLIKQKYTNLVLGLIIILLGLILINYNFEFSYLLWLGLKPVSFYTVDYFPLLPWFGIVLIGIFVGNTLYPNYQRRFSLVDLSDKKPIKILTFMGRHSLIIYLVHQPIILGILYLYIQL